MKPKDRYRESTNLVQVNHPPILHLRMAMAK